MSVADETDDTPPALVGKVMPVHEAGKQVAAAYRSGLADGKRNAASEVARRLREVFGRVCAEPCPHVGCQAQHIVTDVREQVSRPGQLTQPTAAPSAAGGADGGAGRG